MNILIHIISGVILSFIINYFDKKRNFKEILILIISSNFIDLDHLLANPIYDQYRCSINFHPLHNLYMLPLYIIGIFWKKYSYFFIGIMLHLMLDWADCLI